MRKNSEIVGALLFGRRMGVLFLSIEASFRSVFPLNKTISLIHSHFVQTIPTLRRHIYLIAHNISCAILELSGTIPELADKVRILTLRKTIPESELADKVRILTLRQTIPELYRFLLCAEYIYIYIYIFFFFFFLRKHVLTMSRLKTICMKCHSLFSRE